jgi:hypothetical protein
LEAAAYFEWHTSSALCDVLADSNENNKIMSEISETYNQCVHVVCHGYMSVESLALGNNGLTDVATEMGESRLTGVAKEMGDSSEKNFICRHLQLLDGSRVNKTHVRIVFALRITVARV